MIRRRVIVRGLVQGVFFRDSVRRRASTLGVSGWIRNTGDGAVEAPALPPVRIAPGHVHGGLAAAGERLAELVAGHQETFAGGGAG